MTKKTLFRITLWCLLPMFLLSSTAWGGQDSSLNVEPPFWWTGFKESELQLMVHGENISDYSVQLDYPGVTIQRITRVKSPNYLFVYLDIGTGAIPGEFDISFSHDNETLEYRYRLQARNPDPEFTRAFSSADTIYLITPDRFANGDPDNDNIEGMGDAVDRSDPDGRHGGDIKGIADNLDYIANLGFTAIWLNPLLENHMPSYSYHGYASTDFYRVDARFGSNEEYRDLVRQARSSGIGVIMDMIVNHAGSKHWWMDDLPTGDWLNFQNDIQITSHEHISEQDLYASEYDKRMYSDGWFVETMPDLNQRNPLLADYLTQNALWWIEYLGLAGIRMDTYPYPDKHYMTEWTRRLMVEYPHFNMVGEEWTDNPAGVAYWQAGNKNKDGYVSYLPSLMDFPLQNALRWGLATDEGSKMEDLRPGGLLYLYRALANDFIYPDPSALVIFPDNHDMSRIYTQLEEDYDLYRMALAYVLTMRGAPQIYYGTEILMANPGTEGHGVIRSDFPGGWKGDGKNAFTGEGLSEKELDAQNFLRTLLTWRRGQEVIHSGRLTHFVPEDGTYVYFRHDDSDSVMVVLNKNTEDVQLDLLRFDERLEGYQKASDVITGENMQLGSTLTLPARSVRVLELHK
ncbi:MAG: glycoside hydrolase family 13 protein [Gammaproteobacteria bacterium]|nr:glycoside hydrolase family 13 protein [Gammaproteobacteria bacterium]